MSFHNRVGVKSAASTQVDEWMNFGVNRSPQAITLKIITEPPTLQEAAYGL